MADIKVKAIKITHGPININATKLKQTGHHKTIEMAARISMPPKIDIA